MPRCLLMLLLLPLLLAAPPAHAIEQYITAEAGIFFPDNDDLDAGFTIEGAYGTRLVDIAPALSGHGSFWQKIWLEAGGGYYHADHERAGDVDVFPLTISALLRLPVNRVFDLYAGAGGGLYLVNRDFPDGNDDTNADLGAQAIGGIGFHVAPKVDLTLESKWRVVKDDADGAILTGGVQVAF